MNTDNKSGDTATPKKVDAETAKAEVQKWLEYKKLKQSKIDANEDQIEALVDAVSDGSIRFDDDFNIIHLLSFPIKNAKGEITIRELKYKARVNQRELKQYMKGAKASDADERVTRIVCALTTQAPGIIDNLDSVDYSISTNIAIFFL